MFNLQKYQYLLIGFCFMLCIFLVKVLTDLIAGFFKGTSSDEQAHFAYIREIKEIGYSKHTVLSSYLGATKSGYPTFYHALLSLLPQNFVVKRAAFINTIISSCSILLTFLFFLFFSKNLKSDFSSNAIFYLILFASTPYFYFVFNAKSIGISGRNFGIFLGYFYEFSLYVFITNPSWYFLLLVIFINVLILISSQFSSQFVILNALFFALFFMNILPLLILLVSVAIHVLIFRKKAINFYICQYHHKRNFIKYLSPVYLFKYRESIWQDWLGNIYKKDRKYFLTNNLIVALMGFPTVFIAFFLFIKNYNTGIDFSLTDKFFISGVGIFIFTTFKYTRFLGEPERYLEYILPFALLILLNCISNSFAILLMISTTNVYFIVVHLKYFLKDSFSSNIPQKITNIKSKLGDNLMNKPTILFSNNIFFLHFFLDIKKIKIAMPMVDDLPPKGFGLGEIYPNEYGVFRPERVLDYINYTKSNFYLHENTRFNIGDYPDLFSKLEEIYAEDFLILYKIN
jgi:hypothetical protein